MTATEARPRSADLLAESANFLEMRVRDAFIIADYAGALHDVEVILSRDPDNQLGLWYKALILYRKERWREAIKILEMLERPTIMETVTHGWSQIFLAEKAGTARAEVRELYLGGLKHLEDGLSRWAADSHGHTSDDWDCHIRNLRSRREDKLAEKLVNQAAVLKKTPPPRPRQQRGKKRHGGRT